MDLRVNVLEKDVYLAGMPAGSIRREFFIDGDKLTLNTKVYGSKAESVEIYRRTQSNV